MGYKLIAIDMDGTLLNSKQKVSQKNIQAIQEAKSKGVYIVLCSGRAYDGIIDSAKVLGINESDQYMICYGGSVIQNYDQEVLYQRTLKNENCEEIARFLTDKKIHYKFIDNTGTLYQSYQDWIEKHMLNPKLGIVKVLLKTRKHKLPEVLKLVHEQYDSNYFVVQTSEKELEIFPKDVNKGNALERLTKYLKISPKEVMAIGDYDNDMPMFRAAKFSVAVGNAISKVKDLSDVVVADNDHDGVAEAIEKYVLK